MPPTFHASLTKEDAHTNRFKKPSNIHHEESKDMQHDHIVISIPGIMPDVCCSFTVWYSVDVDVGDKVEKFHMPKMDLYNTLHQNGELENISYDKFEPVLMDYAISKILLNSDTEIYNLLVNEHDETLPERDTCEHIIYDCDYLRGRCVMEDLVLELYRIAL